MTAKSREEWGRAAGCCSNWNSVTFAHSLYIWQAWQEWEACRDLLLGNNTSSQPVTLLHPVWAANQQIYTSYVCCEKPAEPCVTQWITHTHTHMLYTTHTHLQMAALCESDVFSKLLADERLSKKPGCFRRLCRCVEKWCVLFLVCFGLFFFFFLSTLLPVWVCRVTRTHPELSLDQH